jgi:hypothetical protein
MHNLFHTRTFISMDTKSTVGSDDTVFTTIKFTVFEKARFI